MTVQGEERPMVKNVMTLKSCSPIVGADVMSFDTEKEVLAWKVRSLHCSLAERLFCGSIFISINSFKTDQYV